MALGQEALTTSFAGVVQTAAIKTARLAKYDVANALIVMAICQSAMGCDEARAVVTAHQMSDPEGSSFTLFKLLEARFTLKALQTLQKLLVELNSLLCGFGETTSQILDCFNKLVLGINVIDAAQLPTEFALITILKKCRFCEVQVTARNPGSHDQSRPSQGKNLNWENKMEIGSEVPLMTS